MKAHGNHIWTLARKELRGFFFSPVAMIFLAVFLVAVLFAFFFVDGFMARDVADIKPLFQRLPVLLIFLVAALTMRMWSEEQKVGTLEVLLTLPVPSWKLVAGKFLAGLLLIALALGLTLGVPITVGMLGNLDWGPVFGGYLAALLLAGAYLSIGLCVSALTDNQIVSLVVTSLACLVLYFIGTAVTTTGMSYATAEVMREIGTGSRFESVARGVIDLRDLVYWGSLIGLFLAVNVFILETKSWARHSGPPGKGRIAPAAIVSSRQNRAKVAIALLAANVIALNLWVAPLRTIRFDLTEEGLYELSPVTKDLLASLDEPLVIRGYFSEKTHPLVAPMVSKIRDQLEEYDEVGGDKVRVEFVDPSKNEELEKEAYDQYGIDTITFKFRDRHSSEVVNAYFHVLVQYGDQHIVLDFDDLVDIQPVSATDVELRLNNFEYNLTGAIKKVATGFQSLESLFASLEATPKLTFYVNQSALPPQLADVPAKVSEVAAKVAADAGGKIKFETVTPTQAQVPELAKEYGLSPRLSLATGKAFFFDLVLEVGDRVVVVPPPTESDEAAVKKTLIEGLKRASPGFTKTVGIVTPPAAAPPRPQFPGQPQQRPRPPQTFQGLRQALSKNYAVRAVSLASGKVDRSIDVLLLAGPEKLDDKALEAIDQFLMRGGAVIALVGRYRIDPNSRDTLALEPVDPGLSDLLKSYGIDVEAKLVEDTRADRFLVPIARPGRRPALFTAEKYPFAVRVSGDGLANHITTNPLNAVVLHYASPVKLMTPQAQVGEKETVKTMPLLESSGDSWLQVNTSIAPDFNAFPERGFGRPDTVPETDKGPQVLAAVATGSFTSHFAKHPDDASKKDDASAEGDDKGKGDDRPLLERSSPDARLAVVGSSAFVDDLTLRLAQGAESQDAQNNIDLVLNLVDWGLADTDLLKIRARGAHTRSLDLDEDARTRWEFINYGIALVALGLFIGVVLWRRRHLPQFDLDPAARHRWTGAGAGAGAAAAAPSREPPDEADADADAAEEEE